MIIAELRGGLGNQLFQYAFAFSISRRRNVPLKLNIESIGRRGYQLQPFNLTETETVNLQNLNNVQWFKENKNAQAPINPPEVSCPLVLSGSWINSYYFSEAADDIRNEFCIVEAPPEPELHSIGETNSVAIHVRRGDYLGIDNTQNICTLKYYQQSIDRLRTQLNTPVFFIFSDDLSWAREHLTGKDIKYVESLSNYQDLYLMSQCKHNIIANSTFSWWGAWLNLNPTKIVIYPERWMNNNLPFTNITNIIPRSWRTHEQSL